MSGPALIDFSLAMQQPSAWNLPGRWLFERANRLDRFALERMRKRYEAPAGGSQGAAVTVPYGGLGGGSVLLRLHALGRSFKRLLRAAGSRGGRHGE